MILICDILGSDQVRGRRWRRRLYWRQWRLYGRAWRRLRNEVLLQQKEEEAVKRCYKVTPCITSINFHKYIRQSQLKGNSILFLGRLCVLRKKLSTFRSSAVGLASSSSGVDHELNELRRKKLRLECAKLELEVERLPLECAKLELQIQQLQRELLAGHNNI